MNRAAASARAGESAALLSIGQVLARLQPEFPDLTPSKLRFLEEQGLVSPARSASGYRKFSNVDVERISLVLSMQRDHYLPLKVIRAHLAAIDLGDTPVLPVPVDGYLTSAPRYHRDELIKMSGASAALFDEAVSASLIAPADVYGEPQRVLLSALAALRGIGIEPRHLRALRASAERDATLIERAMAPSRRIDASDKARAAERASELATQVEHVYGAVLRESLKRMTR